MQFLEGILFVPSKMLYVGHIWKLFTWYVSSWYNTVTNKLQSVDPHSWKQMELNFPLKLLSLVIAAYFPLVSRPTKLSFPILEVARPP